MHTTLNMLYFIRKISLLIAVAGVGTGTGQSIRRMDIVKKSHSKKGNLVLDSHVTHTC